LPFTATLRESTASITALAGIDLQIKNPRQKSNEHELVLLTHYKI